MAFSDTRLKDYHSIQLIIVLNWTIVFFSRNNDLTCHNFANFQIELIATSGSVDKCIYKGFLISWRTELAEPMTDKSVHLPLLLCRGTQSAMKTVHSIVSRMFDCTIVALPITDNDLKWLLPINLSPESNNSSKVKNELILLEYVVPRLPLTDTISVKFRVKDLKDLWTAYVQRRI